MKCDQFGQFIVEGGGGGALYCEYGNVNSDHGNTESDQDSVQLPTKHCYLISLSLRGVGVGWIACIGRYNVKGRMCTTTLVKSVDQFVLGVGVGLRSQWEGVRPTYRVYVRRLQSRL